ncbi:hypothetical protein FBY22_2815 [Streptomyces sp. SLBN-31]|nr:hypothetical protein FBY22_2815 [Streptomyces sp. SLBN-31]
MHFFRHGTNGATLERRDRLEKFFALLLTREFFRGESKWTLDQ